MSTLQMYMNESRIENNFEDEAWHEVWGKNFGVDNAVGKIHRILLHRPGKEIEALSEAPYEEEAGARILRNEKGRIHSYWKSREKPDLSKMIEEHKNLETILRKEDIEIVWLDDPSGIWTNLTFARDVALMTPHGAILTRFAMYFHQGDTYCAQKVLADADIPILGAIQGRGTVEGGAFCVLDAHTAIVSRSVRVNDEGIEQLRQLLAAQDMELIVLDMPASYIHLDEAFVPVDRDKLLVSTFILPHWFLKKMEDRGYQLIETDPSDPPLTNNCLTLQPGKVLFNVFGTKTRQNLEKAGVEVIPVDVSEINKLGGGIHCATLPLCRDSLQ